MTDTTVRGIPGSVFADELELGSVVEAPCTGRVPIRTDDDNRRTDWLICDVLDRPHEAGTRHWATIVRIRRSPGGGIVSAIVRTEDGDEIPWSEATHRAVRTLLPTT